MDIIDKIGRVLSEVKFNIGDRVKISGGSGPDSDKVGTIVKWVTSMGGINRPMIDSKTQVAIHLDDGDWEDKGTVMFKSRLMKIDKAGKIIK